MDASDGDRGFLREPARASDALGHSRNSETVAVKIAMPDGSSAKRRILVVEDEMLIGMLLEDMLTDMGYEVAAIVPRLKEALAAVERESFDLAVLDVHLHGESAFPVAEALIAKGVPFIFATGYGERGLPENYRNRPVLQKPFAKDDLERSLKALIPQS
jgi:DNA-binding response OmpR family regulator